MSSLGLRWKQVGSTASGRITPTFPASRAFVLHLIPNLTRSILDTSDMTTPAFEGNGINSKQLSPRPLGGEGPGGEGVESGPLSLSEQY